MLTALDHLVIVVADLDAATASYRELGFTVVAGGRHPGLGTRNALTAFEDGSYIELIAFDEPRPDHRWWTPLQQGGGLVDFCLRTDDVAGDAAALRQAGVDMGDPEARSRQRPDGVEIRWIFSLPQGRDRGVAPFIIADVTGRDERVPRTRLHANGATGVGAVTVAVDDVARVRRWYVDLLERPGQAIRRPELGAAGVRFVLGPHTFDFVAPTGLEGPIGEWLRRRGASPYAVTLTTAAGRSGPLDPTKTLGARLAWA